MASLVKEMERLRDTVEAVEGKIHSFWKVPKKTILSAGVLAIFILAILLGEAQVAWGVGIFSGAWGEFHIKVIYT